MPSIGEQRHNKQWCHAGPKLYQLLVHEQPMEYGEMVDLNQALRGIV